MVHHDNLVRYFSYSQDLFISLTNAETNWNIAGTWHHRFRLSFTTVLGTTADKRPPSLLSPYPPPSRPPHPKKHLGLLKCKEEKKSLVIWVHVDIGQPHMCWRKCRDKKILIFLLRFWKLINKIRLEE